MRFEDLTIEAKCYVGNRALPTLINTTRNIAESALDLIGITLAKRTKLTILKDASGIIKPSRLVSLLENILMGVDRGHTICLMIVGEKSLKLLRFLYSCKF